MARQRKYDRPGRPPIEGVPTTCVNISVLPDEWAQFRVHCDKRGVSASAEIRQFIKRELRRNARG